MIECPTCHGDGGEWLGPGNSPWPTYAGPCRTCDGAREIEAEPLDEEPDLSEIHAWQATPEGIIALRMMDLMTAISELDHLADNPNVLPLVAAERTDLELANATLTRLLARVPS